MRLGRLTRWLAVTIVAICAIVLLALGLTQTAWGRERARRIIESRASAALNGEVRVGEFRWSPRGRIELKDLVLTQGGQPFVASPSVSVRYQTWQVLTRGLVFDEVTLERPAIHLVERADGWNVLRLLRERPHDDSSGRSISIRRLRIHDGSLDVNPLRTPRRELAALNVDAEMKYAERQLRARVTSGSARDARTGLVLSRLQVMTTVGEGELTFEDIDMLAGASRVTGKVRRVSSDEQTDLDISLDAEPLALSEVGYYVPRLRSLALSPSLKLRARGTTQKMTVNLAMESAAGRVSGLVTGGFQHDVGRFAGDVSVAGLDLAPWLNRSDLASRITGTSSVDLVVPESGYDAATISFNASLSDIAIAGYAASGVRARGSYGSGRLAAEGSGAAYGATFTTAARWERVSRELSARGRFAGLDLRRLPRQLNVPRMESVLAGAYDAMIAPRTWRGDVILDGSVLEGARIAEGATGRVDTRVPGIAYAFKGTVTGIDPDRFKPFVKTSAGALDRLHGRLNATIDLDARGSRLVDASTRLNLALVDSVVCPTPGGCVADGSTSTRIDRLDASVTLERRRLVADVRGEARAIRAASVGVEHPSNAAGDGRIDAHVVVADVLAPLSVETVEGTATAAFTNASLFGQTIDEATIDAAMRGGVARVSALDVRGPGGRLTANGSITFTGEGQSDLKYVLDVVDLQSFQSLTAQALRGTAHIEGQVTGPARSLKTVGTLSANNLTVGPAEALSLKSTFDVTIPDNDVKRTIGQVALTGTFLQVRGTRIDEVTSTLNYDGTRLEVDATMAERERTLRFAASLVPHPEHHEIHVRSMSVLAGEIEWQMPQGQEAVGQYAADRLVIKNFQLARADSRIRIDGIAAANMGAESALVASVERLRIEDVNRLLLGTRKISGLVDGTARISGALSNPRIDAEMQVTSGQVDGVAFDSLGGRVSLAGPRLTLDVRLEAGASGRLTAVGTMPVNWRGAVKADAPPFDLRVQSATINLALFQPMLSHVDMVTGTGRFDLQISGAASAPRIEGLVGVQTGSFRVVPTDVIYSGVEAAMAVEGDRLTVQQLRVQDDDGHVASVVGSLKVAALGRPSDFNLSVNGRDFHVLHNRFGEISVSPELRIMGDLTSPLVTGTVRVDRGRAEVSDLLERFAATGYRPVEVEPARQVEDAIQASAPSTGASYSVTVDLPDNLVLRGRDLRSARGPVGLGDINVTLGGALTVAKDSGGPTTLLGRLVVIRGQYTFQGRPFTILRDSELRFGGEEMLNPFVDVRAERQISGVTARVHVTGTMQRPEIALSSQPPLDEGDILSLIAFNQTMNQLQTSERVSLAARAGVLAARAFATPIADSVARALDFDLFEIQPADDAGSGATVTVGRQVNDRLFVGFKHEFGSDDVSQVSFEYRLNQFLRVVTSFAEGVEDSRRVPRVDRAGVDFIFVIRR
ncbi:MAG TPA: translocation/assembly module TamB domain-containing protein [Vicinamibacterales bacterium]|nr:translocation/assembly module TamB domain-containing protein [Vicinamibacterales bacterium]